MIKIVVLTKLASGAGVATRTVALACHMVALTAMLTVTGLLAPSAPEPCQAVGLSDSWLQHSTHTHRFHQLCLSFSCVF